MKYNTGISEKDQLKIEKERIQREQYLQRPTKINRVQTRNAETKAPQYEKVWVTHTVEPMSNKMYQVYLQDLISEVGYKSVEYREIAEYQKTPEDTEGVR